MSEVMKFSFGINHTKHGCTVWMDGPSGHRYRARFRNGYSSALASAEKWVWEKRQVLTQEAGFTGKQVAFEVPPELDRANDRKMVNLPVNLWAEIEKLAGDGGIGHSEWIREAVLEKLRAVAK
jgi:hypothetical protein